MSLEAVGLALAYSVGGSKVDVLDDASLAVSGGTSVAVMGPSGSGKSTLLRLLAGAQRPDRGTIKIDGQPIKVVGGGSLHPRVALVYQDYRLVEFLTVAENLMLAAEVRRKTLGPQDAAGLLELVGLGGYGERVPATLSGGQQQRAAIARALAADVGTILADEPTGALDRENSDAVASLLRGLADERSVSVIVATHDVAVANRMHSRLRLKDGRLVDGDVT